MFDEPGSAFGRGAVATHKTGKSRGSKGTISYFSRSRSEGGPEMNVLPNLSLVDPHQRNLHPAKIRNLQRLEEQRIEKSWLESIEEAGTINIGSLRIAWTDLHTLHPSVLTIESTYGIKLLTISLVGVKLMSLPEEFGTVLKNLKRISLRQNNLVNLPDSLCEVQSLEEIDVAYNKLIRLPERIGFLSSLQTLVIHNNKLEVLPVTLGALRKLQRLDLECNSLTRLPENLDHLISCHTVNVSQNRLLTLPRCFGRMPNLKVLSAAQNCLKAVPDELYKSFSLRRLRLLKNNLEALSDGIGSLYELEELDLSHNHLKRLPLTFWKLQNLSVLRLDGNYEILDPPPEVINEGAAAVVEHCKNVFFSDKQTRMRHIILSVQNVLAQASERGIPDPAQFQAEIVLDHREMWFGLQMKHFWDDILPIMKSVWSRRVQSHSTDDITDFPFSEKEVMWAFSNFTDAHGSLMRKGKTMFRRCACVGADGRPMICVPPAIGFMCYRSCVLLKQHITRVRDKQEQQWQAYKVNSMLDAIRRAEVEARTYLDSTAGRRWLEDVAYEQAEELLAERGAAGVADVRAADADRRKQSIIRKFDKLKARVEKQKDKKLKELNSELEMVRDRWKDTNEGYVRDKLDERMKDIIESMSTLPELKQLEMLQDQCEKQCQQVDDQLYHSSSHSSEVSELEDSSMFSSNDSSSEAEQWRARRLRYLSKKKLFEAQEEERLREKLRKDAAKARERSRNGDERTALEALSHAVDMAVETVNVAVVEPTVKPVIEKSLRQTRRAVRNIRRTLRNLVDISRMKVRRITLRMNGEFEEIQLELRYELYRQYVEHAVTLARERAQGEFSAIETVRHNFQGISKQRMFLEWKRWVWTKQTRYRRDTRKKFKMAYQAYIASMESIRTAQLRVDEWKENHDIFSDQLYWQHCRTGQVTMDAPSINHFLPPTFFIPPIPDPLPPDVPFESSSSSDESVTDWQRRHGQSRQAFAKKEKELAEQRACAAKEEALKNSTTTEIDEPITQRSTISSGRGRLGLGSLDPNLINDDTVSRSCSTPKAGDGGDADDESAEGQISNKICTDQFNLPSISKRPLAASHVTDSAEVLLRLPTIESSLRALDFGAPEPKDQVVEYITQGKDTEFESAYKIIRKRRQGIDAVRHQTYLAEHARKPVSFEQILAEHERQKKEEEDRIAAAITEDEALMATYLARQKAERDAKKPSALKYTDAELLELAGGTLEMVVDTGKDGFELRSILAQRAVTLRSKLNQRAAEKGLIQPKKKTFWQRHIQPMFLHRFEDEDEDDDEEREKRRQEAKLALRARRRADRFEQKEFNRKLDNAK